MPVRFLVTGFGQFAGVQCNPTQQLVEWLRTEHQHRLPQLPSCKAFSSTTAAADGPPATAHNGYTALASAHAMTGMVNDDFQVLSCTVLEVSAEAVASFLEEQQLRLQKACSSSNGEPIVLLHLGVDTQRTCLNLELQAYNNACFRCPDQAGWQPNNVTIERGAGLNINSTRCTSLPLQQIATELRAAGFDCQVSQDAGRFVCNYTYHRSLQLAASLGGQLQQHKQGIAQQAAGKPVSHNSSRSSCSCDTTQAASTTSCSDGESAAQQGGNESQPTDVSGEAAAAADAAGVCASSPCYSVFAHVPSFTSIPEIKQREFLFELMCCINKHLGTLPEGPA